MNFAQYLMVLSIAGIMMAIGIVLTGLYLVTHDRVNDGTLFIIFASAVAVVSLIVVQIALFINKSK